MYGIFGLPHYVSSLVNFRESPKGEVRRISILRTPVNRGQELPNLPKTDLRGNCSPL
jgi:hypothetical protein